MLYIRVDANKTIGSGHLMRCLSVADAYSKTGSDVIFIVADYGAADIISERGYGIRCIESEWNNLESELDKLIRLICDEQIEILLVDSYFASEYYLSVLHNYTRLVYIDDFGSSVYQVDLLINYSAHADNMKYLQNYTKDSATEFALGCGYAPLNKQFHNISPRTVHKTVKNIIFMTGGADTYHVALKFVKDAVKYNAYPEQTIYVICGHYNADYDEICSITDSADNIQICRDVNNISEYMLNADIAVTAGGSTVYELCACGTPAVCYVLADNQIANARAFGDKGIMLYGGDVRNANWLADVKSCIEILISDYSLRANMSKCMQSIVDGKGAVRIADRIEKLTGKEV